MEIREDIRRVTLPLPFPPGHVHVYLLRGETGWTAVDTGLGLPEAGASWRGISASLDEPLVRLVVTHFHPDHVGAGADIVALFGLTAHQGELDYAQCEAVWGSLDWPERVAAWLELHGTPSAIARYADGEPDPLGAYLASLERTEELAPEVALPGHGEPIHDPAGRARELIEHHQERLDATAAALAYGARTAYEVSLEVFPHDLDASGRRFAVAETLAHLERLAVEGRAEQAHGRWLAPS